jgi:hypothetical protein
VRGIGPSLAQANVPNPLQDPVLEIHNANGVIVAQNDNWTNTQGSAIAATGLAPSDVRGSAIITTLPQGAWTAVLSGKNNTSGVALVEVYNVP